MIPSDPNVFNGKLRLLNYANISDNYKLFVFFVQKLNEWFLDCTQIIFVSDLKFDYTPVHPLDLEAKCRCVAFNPWFVLFELLWQLFVGCTRKSDLMVVILLVFNQVLNLFLSRVAVQLVANKHKISWNFFILWPILKKIDILKVATCLLIFYFKSNFPNTRARKRQSLAVYHYRFIHDLGYINSGVIDIVGH